MDCGSPYNHGHCQALQLSSILVMLRTRRNCQPSSEMVCRADKPSRGKGAKDRRKQKEIENISIPPSNPSSQLNHHHYQSPPLHLTPHASSKSPHDTIRSSNKSCNVVQKKKTRDKKNGRDRGGQAKCRKSTLMCSVPHRSDWQEIPTVHVR